MDVKFIKGKYYLLKKRCFGIDPATFKCDYSERSADPAKLISEKGEVVYDYFSTTYWELITHPTEECFEVGAHYERLLGGGGWLKVRYI